MALAVRIVLVVVVIAFLALIAYSYLPGTLVPVQSEISRPVTLDANE